MHSLTVTAATAAFLLANLTCAAPTPIVVAPDAHITAAPSLEKRQDGTVNGVSFVSAAPFICTLSVNDPTSFDKSGATGFVDDFLVTNGDSEWLNNMDAKTTGDGTHPSTLNCTTLDGTFCPAPPDFVTCEMFTPPEYFFVRHAAATARSFFASASSALTDFAIVETLNIDAILSDFVPQNSDDLGDDSDALSALISGLGAAFSLAKEVGGDESLGIVGGLFSVASGLTHIDPQATVSLSTLKIAVESQLSDIFTGTKTQIANMDSKLFGGNSDFDLGNLVSFVSKATGIKPDPSLQPISQIFSTGAFMQTTDENAVTQSLRDTFQLFRQQLVIGALAAQNIFVFVDTTRTEDDCNAIPGSSFISNQCFTLEQRTVNHIACDPDSKPIDGSIVAKFNEPTYNISLNDFFQNVQACDNGHTFAGLTGFHTDAPPSPTTAVFPKCAFNIPYVQASGGVCNAPGSGLPPNLQINFDDCQKTVFFC